MACAGSMRSGRHLVVWCDVISCMHSSSRRVRMRMCRHGVVCVCVYLQIQDGIEGDVVIVMYIYIYCVYQQEEGGGGGGCTRDEDACIVSRARGMAKLRACRSKALRARESLGRRGR
jgi:hypothetical protein